MNDQIERVARVLYETYGFQHNFRWDYAPQTTQDQWRGLAAAAIKEVLGDAG